MAEKITITLDDETHEIMQLCFPVAMTGAERARMAMNQGLVSQLSTLFADSDPQEVMEMLRTEYDLGMEVEVDDSEMDDP